MKNGKLFGKLNVIDLIIILILIACIVFLCVRFLGNSAPQATAPDQVRLTFFAPDAPALLAGKCESGEPVTDYDDGTYLGAISLYESEDAYKYEYDDANGEPVKVPDPNKIFLTFSCDGAGYVSDTGLFINGNRYCIGGTYVICAGQTRVSCRLADFEIIG